MYYLGFLSLDIYIWFDPSNNVISDNGLVIILYLKQW